MLVPADPALLPQALLHMHQATQDCLRRLAEQQSQHVTRTKSVAQDIFGWQVILAVDHAHLQDTRSGI